MTTLRRARPDDPDLLCLQLQTLREQQRWVELQDLVHRCAAACDGGQAARLVEWVADLAASVVGDEEVPPGTRAAVTRLPGQLLDALDARRLLEPHGAIWQTLDLRELDLPRYVDKVILSRDPDLLRELPWALRDLEPAQLQARLSRLPACASLFSRLAQELHGEERGPEACQVLREGLRRLPEDFELGARLDQLLRDE